MLAAFSSGLLGVIVLMVYGTRSDFDHLHPAIKKLLPAGHCLCQSSPVFECTTCLDLAEATDASGWPDHVPNTTDSLSTWKYTYGRDDVDEALHPALCDAAFPGLFEDIDRAVKLRKDDPITPEHLANMKMYNGMGRAMIYDGEVCRPKSRNRVFE